MKSWRSSARIGAIVWLAGACLPAGALAVRSGSAAEIRQHVATLNQAIEQANEPMRNKMFMEFRLIEQDNPGAVAPILLENLKSPLAGVPEYTAFILGWVSWDKQKTPPAVRRQVTEALQAQLQATDGLKRAALQALGNMEAVEALDSMIALTGDPSPRVRQDAAYSLGLLGDARAKPTLEKLAGDPDELVRFMAAEAIERIDNRLKYGW